MKKRLLLYLVTLIFCACKEKSNDRKSFILDHDIKKSDFFNSDLLISSQLSTWDEKYTITNRDTVIFKFILDNNESLRNLANNENLEYEEFFSFGYTQEVYPIRIPLFTNVRKESDTLRFRIDISKLKDKEFMKRGNKKVEFYGEIRSSFIDNKLDWQYDTTFVSTKEILLIK
ncbi:hypothetical protein [Flammeovirga sp. OC4]|uniref:hypothetical protein n=1 Tax=Flammeovirga sp. OC4 TaxID=1382345 RepID=UPI0005C45EAD|nr:hypothetical protein [Flammeovirga sp. OC4]